MRSAFVAAVSAVAMLSACGSSSNDDAASSGNTQALPSSQVPVITVENPQQDSVTGLPIGAQVLPSNANLSGFTLLGGSDSLLSSPLVGWLAQAGCLYYTTASDSMEKKSGSTRFFASAGCTLVPTALNWLGGSI